MTPLYIKIYQGSKSTHGATGQRTFCGVDAKEYFRCTGDMQLYTAVKTVTCDSCLKMIKKMTTKYTKENAGKEIPEEE